MFRIYLLLLITVAYSQTITLEFNHNKRPLQASNTIEIYDPKSKTQQAKLTQIIHLNDKTATQSHQNQERIKLINQLKALGYQEIIFAKGSPRYKRKYYECLQSDPLALKYRDERSFQHCQKQMHKKHEVGEALDFDEEMYTIDRLLNLKFNNMEIIKEGSQDFKRYYYKCLQTNPKALKYKKAQCEYCFDVAKQHDQGKLNTMEIIYRPKSDIELSPSAQERCYLELSQMGFKNIRIEKNKTQHYNQYFNECLNRDKIALAKKSDWKAADKRCRFIATKKEIKLEGNKIFVYKKYY